MRLDKKNIIVTAAAQGIGKATALRFANEGATVLATDINEDRLKDLKKENDNIQIMKLDATNKNDVEVFCSSGEQAASASRRRESKVAPGKRCLATSRKVRGRDSAAALFKAGLFSRCSCSS